jgi:hypothetical protein
MAGAHPCPVPDVHSGPRHRLNVTRQLKWIAIGPTGRRTRIFAVTYRRIAF